jgi:hypothetical protein
MTIGPDPMIITLLMSSRFGMTLHPLLAFSDDFLISHPDDFIQSRNKKALLAQFFMLVQIKLDTKPKDEKIHGFLRII